MKAIGKLLMYVNDHVLPATPFPDVYNCTDEDELEYLKQFGKQLFLDESELKRFKFPAASLLVNDDLNPHEDLMNPHNIEMDYTLALSLVVPISEVLSDYQQILKTRYPAGVPLCLVLYRRRCLECFVLRNKRWKGFLDCNSNEVNGRRKMYQMMRKVNTPADYTGYFWKKSNRLALRKTFDVLEIPGSTSKTPLKCACYPEAIDKMVSVNEL